MINGIDLLFIVIGLLLLWVVWEFSSLYSYWSKWDINRRRARKLALYDMNDRLEEEAYRDYLRRLLRPGMIMAMRMMTESMENFRRAMSMPEEEDYLREFDRM